MRSTFRDVVSLTYVRNMYICKHKHNTGDVWQYNGKVEIDSELRVYRS